MKNKPSARRADDGKQQMKKVKGTVQEQVYQELRRSLMTGAFMPGAKVTIRGVSEQIGTSMMPVREAISRLVAERALELTGNRQVIVPLMTAEKFAEITHWRIQLESAAVSRACQRMSADFIAELEDINGKITEAADKDLRDGVLRWNYEFHFRIYRQAHSTLLLPMIESLWLQAGPFMYYSTPGPKVLWSAKHHRDIVRALRNKEESAAVEAVARDIKNTADFLKNSGHFARPVVRRLADIAA